MIAKIQWTNNNRLFPYPAEQWTGYQEWHKVVFIHYKVEAKIINAVIPSELTVDTMDDHAWISIVALTVKNLRPRLLPPFPPLSNFHEVNLRTYVTHNNVPGIYFFSLEASRLLPVIAAKLSTGLPYVKSDIWRDGGLYKCKSFSHEFQMHLDYILPSDGFKIKSHSDSWLTDRYRLYVKTSRQISRIDVHHQPWDLDAITLRDLSLNYKIGKFSLSKHVPQMIHYSEGVKVATWRKKSTLNSDSLY